MEIRFCEEVPEIKTEIFNNGRKATVNLYRDEEIGTLPEYPNYHITSCGRVYSWYVNRFLKYGFLKEKPNKAGRQKIYVRYRLKNVKENKRKWVMAHVLVWKLYGAYPIPENGVVHHLTDDSLDNRIINLSAMTKKDHDRITGNMILQIEKEAGDKNTFARNGKPYPWIEGEFFESNEKAAEFLGTSVKELTAFLRRKPEAVFGNSKAWHWKDGRIIMKSPKLFSDKNTLLYFEN